MNTILGFKNLEDEELEDHACSVNLREKMLEFHAGLMTVISIDSLEEEEHIETEEEIQRRKPTVWKTIWKVIQNSSQNEGSKDDEEASRRKKSPEEKFRKVLIETITRWGCEAEIESTELVREMFSLLLRQYDTVGELMRASENTYIVDAKTKPDVEEMWVSLSRIRSLLPVQMSKEEEELVRELLWYDSISIL